MEIINKEIPISKDKCMPPAEKFFAGASGMSKNRRSYANLKKLSLETLDMIYDRIGIKAVFSYYEDIFFDGKKAVIGGVEFVSAAFEQLDPSRIKGAYVYMLTIGDTSLKNSPVIKNSDGQWAHVSLMLQDDLEKKIFFRRHYWVMLSGPALTDGYRA